jgi:membrane associated rhomboid family serine protease
MTPASVGFHCPECVSEGRRTVRQPRTVYGGRASARPDIVTMSLIGTNVVAFVVELATGATLFGNAGSSTFVQRFSGSWPSIVFGGEYYRLLTSAFLHQGLIHIGFNMYLLYALGPELERLVGWWRFLVLYLACALGGSALALAFQQSGIGASGAVFGLFSSLYVMLRHRRRDTSQVTSLIVLNLVFSFVMPGIGYWAHIGGLVSGGIIGVSYAFAPPGRVRTLWQLSGPLVVVGASIGLVAAQVAAHSGLVTGLG